MRITGNPPSGGKKPGTPTIGTATAGNTSATVAYTAPSWIGKGGTVTYRATSSPGGLTGTSTTSPITVSGLTNGTAYTFTVVAETSYGVNSNASAASNSVTPAIPAVESFDSIASVNFTSGITGPYTINNIPQTYKHLLLIMYSQQSNFSGTSGVEAPFTFNNVVTNNYNQLGGLYFTGAAAGANAGSNNQPNGWIERGQSMISALAPATSYMWIMDYTNSSTKRSTLYWSGMSVNVSASNSSMVSGTAVLNLTQAVSRIDFNFVGNTSNGTGMSLFGVKA